MPRKRRLGEGRSMAVSLALRRSEGEPRYDSEVSRFSYRDLERDDSPTRVKKLPA